MFEEFEQRGELDPPPIAAENPDAMEVLRVWTAPDVCQQFVLKTTWKDPGAWGVALVDIARHVANAYEREERDRAEILGRIRELFDAEWSSPTDEPLDLTDDVWGGKGGWPPDTEN